MKKQNTLKLLSLILSIAMLAAVFSSCGKNKEKSSDIFVIYTGDVHCSDDENIGYAGLAAYRDYIKTKSDYTVLADTGDAIQGDYPGAVTEGDYIIDMMNTLSYDLAVLGNHEFDYGMEKLSELMAKSKAKFLGCNITYSGSGENPLRTLKPYEIKEFGKTKVGFVGVSTPQSLTSSRPTNFMEEGNTVFDFGEGNNGQRLFDMVQENVNACKREGADHVILLSHLGDTKEDSEYYNSRSLIAATEGVDAVLDGHAHNVIPCDIVSNKKGEEVILSSTGTNLQNIGTLVITADGNVSCGLISSFEKKDGTVTAAIDAFNAEQEAKLSQKLTTSSFSLPISESGVRIVRNRETAIGNLVTDAFRSAAGSDIAIFNGGGIRADLNAGDITYGDVRKITPYQNTLCSVKATGQEIADALEFGYCTVQKNFSDGTNSVGENGGFLQISGIKCTIDTSIPSSVKVDDIGKFISIEGERRVLDIQVADKDGNYSPIDLQKTYTVASISFLLMNMGDGYSMFADNEFVISEGIIDYQVLVDYITAMGESIDDTYAAPQGRITVK